MRKLAVRVLLFALLVAPSFAQTTNARLDGTVQDSTGALVPSAKVVALETKTQTRSEVSTDPAGSFVFPTLQPGLYTISVEAPGFRKTVVNNVELSVGGTVSQIIKLEVGQTSESVSVEANALTVQTTESQVSSAIMMRDIDGLPQLNRNPLTLAIFQPGVQIDIRAGQDSSFSHVNGLRQGSNNSKLDGVDVNDSLVPRLGLSLTANNSDSVGEFRVVTEGGKAEYGRSAGAQVEMVTRSGTNQYHGNAYDYLRNTDLNANDFFNNQSGGAVPKLIRNLFGASFGGPIIHNKTFIFGNYQGTRTIQETVRTRTVPTDSARLGIFRYKVGGAIQSYDIAKNDPRGIGVDPSVAKILASYPAPNTFDVGDGLNTAGFRFNNPTPSHDDQFTIRGDHHLTDNHVLFLRWSWFKTYSVDNLNNADATFPGQIQGAQGGTRWGFSTGSNWTINPTLINEFIIGHQSASVDFLRPNRPNGPAFYPNLFTSIPFNGFGQGRNSPVNDITDTITKVHNNHTFKAGANIRFTLQYGYNYAGIYPTLTSAIANGNNVPASLGPAGLSATDRSTFEKLYNDVLGRIDQVTQTFYSNLKTFQAAGSPRVRNYILHESGYFFQDDWRVTRKLTLNLGMRYEYFGVPFERDNLQGSIDQAASVSNLVSSSNLTLVPGGQLYHKDQNNFAPRFGFAYDPFGTGKTAIRGNWGIFYDRTVGAAFNSIDGNTPGFTQAVPAYPNLNGTDLRLSDTLPLPAQPAAPILTLPTTRSTSLILANPNLRTGYVQSYALNVQQEVFRNTVLQVGYVGNRGVKLFMDVDVNQPRIYGPFLDSFKEIQAYQTNTSLAVSPSNVFVKLYGSASAAISALGATNFSRGLVGTIANTVDRGQFSRYAAAGLPDNFLRYYPQFNQVVLGTNNGRSYYDSLQVSLRRNAGDFQWAANYTWSKSMDNISAEGNGFTTPVDSFNLRLNRARSDFDRPHSFNMSGLYTVPFGKGKRFGSGMPSIVDTAIGGWSIGFLQIAQSGQPFSVGSQRATTAISGVNNSYAVYTGTDYSIGSVDRRGNGVFFFSPDQVAQFTYPAAGQLGNGGRNVFRNAPFFETDASLVKKFRITENHALSFRAEAYNLFNHPNFGLATANLNLDNPATFGKFSQTLGTQVGGSSARTLQLVLRYDF
jgi:hypothetical protein